MRRLIFVLVIGLVFIFILYKLVSLQFFKKTVFQGDENCLIEPNRCHSVLPTPTDAMEDTGDGKFCGGIAGIKCPPFYFCYIKERYPDASGVCIQIRDMKN
jgi:hypothetical protein